MAELSAGDWISVREAAEIIGCTKRNVQHYIDAKLLPAVDIDGFWVVKRADAKRFKRPPRGRPRKDE